MTDLRVTYEPIVPFRKSKLRRLDTTADIEEFFRWLSLSRYALSFDSETGEESGQALKWWLPTFKLRLLQFGDCNGGFVMRADRFGAVIEEVFTRYEGDFVSHNGIGFDGHVLKGAGFSMPPKDKWHDTLMQSRILDSRGSHRLKDIAVRLFGPDANAAEKALNRAFELHGYGKDKGLGFSKIAYGTPAYDVYSAVDVIIGARIDAEFRPQVLSDFKEAYDREIAAWHVTFEHEEQGLPVDLEYAHQLKDKYEEKLILLQHELRQLGISNPNSKIQKVEALTKDGWEPEDFTETGEPKLDKPTLEKIASPLAFMLMEHSRIEGWMTKYIDKVIDDSYNGIVYPTFNPFGAKTGRQAAYGPPVQQLPSRHEDAHEIRRMILARPGEVIYSIDYDGQENRLAASFSKDEALIDLIMSGKDIHTYTAAVVFNIPEEQVSKDQRTLVKNVVYAQQYGAGIKKLMKMLGMDYDQVVQIKEGIKRAYPQFTQWTHELMAEAEVRWHSEGSAYAYTWGGRRVFADEYIDKNGITRYKDYTLTNYVLQGTGADVLKEKMNHIAAAGLSKYILLPVHDELLFSLPEGPAGLELAHELASIMEMPTEFAVPLTCSPSEPSKYWKK